MGFLFRTYQSYDFSGGVGLGFLGVILGILCHNSSLQTFRGADIWTTFEPKIDEEVVDFKKSLQPTDHLSGDEPKNLQVVHDYLGVEKFEFSDTNSAGVPGDQSVPKRRWQNKGRGKRVGERKGKYMRFSWILC